MTLDEIVDHVLNHEYARAIIKSIPCIMLKKELDSYMKKHYPHFMNSEEAIEDLEKIADKVKVSPDVVKREKLKTILGPYHDANGIMTLLFDFNVADKVLYELGTT